MKLYFWIHGYFYKPGSRLLRAALMAVLMPALLSGYVVVLMPAHMSGCVAALMAGDTAPSYAVSGFQPEMPDCSASLDLQITISGHQPDISDIGGSVPIISTH